jgi:hypothetical protein
MKKLLIITGPQGSGNHLWSKVLAETPGVAGWRDLTKTYWIGHGLEPLATVWQRPELFAEVEWNTDYQVTSISCPYQPVGGPLINETAPVHVPKYEKFIKAAQASGVEVKLAIIGREMNIVKYQQARLRGQYTLPMFLKEVKKLTKYNPVFISTELLYLYKQAYLKQLSKTLDFPISITNDKLEEILADNSNAKYLTYVEHNWLDDVMATAANGTNEKLL